MNVNSMKELKTYPSALHTCPAKNTLKFGNHAKSTMSMLRKHTICLSNILKLARRLGAGQFTISGQTNRLTQNTEKPLSNGPI